MELDNFQYKKMRKLMYLDEVENKDGEHTQGITHVPHLRCFLYLLSAISHFSCAVQWTRFSKWISRFIFGWNCSFDLFSLFRLFLSFRCFVFLHEVLVEVVDAKMWTT